MVNKNPLEPVIEVHETDQEVQEQSSVPDDSVSSPEDSNTRSNLTDSSDQSAVHASSISDSSLKSKISKALKFKIDSSSSLEYLFPKEQSPEVLTPERLKQLKRERESILRTYKEGSKIYDHAQYSDTLSDDDVSILAPEENLKNTNVNKLKAERKLKKENTSIYQRSLNLTSSSIQQSSSGTNEERSNSTTSEPLYINCTSKKTKEDKAERGELAFDIDEDFKNLPFKERLEFRKAQWKDAWESHDWRNWLVLALMAAVIISTCFVIPFTLKFGSNPHKPQVNVYEHITDYVYPTLLGIRTSLVDPDTPERFHQRMAKDGEDWDLVFSDEFNAEGRTFYPKMDQFWEAVDLNYAATNDLEWYDPDAAFTEQGTLKLRMDAIKQHDLFYRSGMLQSWNKMCFTEGIMEVSAKLPGSAFTSGLWPGIWTLGNLARPGYTASAEGVWPYTYDECDAGITANQSSPDGISKLPGQKLNKCTLKGEEHPNPGKGRGAPEIDLLEGSHSTDAFFGVASQTLQIAPFDIWYLPDYDFVEVYNFTKSNIAHFLGTPYQEMLSTATTLNETWFERVVETEHPLNIKHDRETYFQKYSVEYLSKSKKRNDNYCRFFVGDEPVSTIYGNALHPNGNIGWRLMPQEPMSMVLNLGISTSWSMIQWLNILFPVTFEIDYVRIYQPKGKNQLTCDPPDFPTSQYIQDHLNAYMNANLTTWEEAGYTFPKHKLMTTHHNGES